MPSRAARPPPSRSRRAAKAARQRQWRARQRAGVAIAPAPYDDETVELLIALEWLDPADAGDPRKIGEAMFAMHKATARRRSGHG